MSTPKIHSVTDLIARVAGLQKSASSTTDPAAGQSVHSTGKPSVPSHPDGDSKTKQQLPADGQNAAADNSTLLDVTKPGPTGTGTPASKTEPAIAPGAKFATTVKELTERATSLFKGASSTAPAAAAVAAPSATTPPPASTTTPAIASTESPKVATAAAVDGLIHFDRDFYTKIGMTIMKYEEGVKVAQRLLAEEQGAAEAEAQIKSAMQAHAVFLAAEQEQQEMEKFASSVQAQQFQFLKNAYDNASPADQKTIEKIASVHRVASSVFGNDHLLKIAYQAGAEDAEAMQQSMGPEGGGEPTLPGAGAPEAPASIEEIAQALEMLVSTGELDEATAIQILEGLQGGGGAGGAPGAGGPPPEGAAPEMPADMPPEAAEAVKAAFRLCAEAA